MISYDVKLLEKAFDVFNSVYFNGSLPRVVLTVQSTPRSNGHFSIQKIWTDSHNSYHEINVGAEGLSRPIEQVLSTLLHEMVHLYCMENNIRDVSNLGRYHNGRFRKECEARDLIIEYAPIIGWSVTKPTTNLINVIKQHRLYEPIEHSRITMEKGKRPKKPSSTRKYICKCCGISIRATKEVNIICGDCMDTMKRLE